MNRQEAISAAGGGYQEAKIAVRSATTLNGDKVPYRASQECRDQAQCAGKGGSPFQALQRRTGVPGWLPEGGPLAGHLRRCAFLKWGPPFLRTRALQLTRQRLAVWGLVIVEGGVNCSSTCGVTAATCCAKAGGIPGGSIPVRTGDPLSPATPKSMTTWPGRGARISASRSHRPVLRGAHARSVATHQMRPARHCRSDASREQERQCPSHRRHALTRKPPSSPG